MADSAHVRTHATGDLRRVLVVEDDPILALFIEETLIDHGIAKVTIASTLEQALGVMEDLRPDAIILDVFLADRNDGWALAELVQMLGPRPPIIVFSTGAPDAIPKEIADLGPILEKPYPPEALIAALSQQTRQSLFSKIRKALS